MSAFCQSLTVLFWLFQKIIQQIIAYKHYGIHDISNQLQHP